MIVHGVPLLNTAMLEPIKATTHDLDIPNPPLYTCYNNAATTVRQMFLELGPSTVTTEQEFRNYSDSIEQTEHGKTLVPTHPTYHPLR